jgi:hypothetical protein
MTMVGKATGSNEVTSTAIFTGAGDDKIDTFAGLRDIKLDRHPGIVRNAGIFQHRIHVSERMLPRGQFSGSHRLAQRALEGLVDDLLDPVGEDVFPELGLVGEVDDHLEASTGWMMPLPEEGVPSLGFTLGLGDAMR